MADETRPCGCARNIACSCLWTVPKDFWGVLAAMASDEALNGRED